MGINGKKITRGLSKAIKILLLLTFLCIAAIAWAGFAWARKVIQKAPDISALSFRPQGFATTVYDRDGNVVEYLVMEGANREEASYQEIPEDLVNAFIAIEDERFWENNGIDLRAVLRAAKGVLTGDPSAGGGSTITQQLVKNTVFNGGMEKTFEEKLERKLQEQYLAVELTRISDKETIMANYLNTINLGSNTLGVKVAARRYFDKELSELTLSECAALAGITQNPSKLNPLTGAGANARRRRRILEKMENQGMISAEEKEEALADDVYSRIQDVNVEAKAQPTPYSYFTDEVVSQVIRAMSEGLGYSRELARKMVYSGGLSIYTTQDLRLQTIVDEEINNPENYKGAFLSDDYGMEAPQPQASFVLLDQHTGEVLAVSGGRGEKAASRTFNRATEALRQPGSIFKVIAVFAPALDGKNATLATVYYDEPYQAGTKEFRNWYGRFFGYSNIREAIAYSMNIVAVRCMVETVSPQLGVWYARNLGISTLSEKDYNPSTALGGITDGVSNLELTAAFGAIGADGVYTTPLFFTRVLDHDGNVLLENKPESRQALKPETAFLLTDAMRDVMVGRNKFAADPVGPTGRRAALASMAAAGKSGTTTGNKDLWFVGYTPYYTAGIWSGNDGGQPVEGNTSYHKDIWKKIMDRAHEGLEDRGFQVVGNVASRQVCRKSGKLAAAGLCEEDPRGNAVYSEYFAQGTEPDSVCDIHEKAAVCMESGGTATEFCPETEEKVFLALPEGGGETEDSRYALPELCPLHPDAESVMEPGETEESGRWDGWKGWGPSGLDGWNWEGRWGQNGQGQDDWEDWPDGSINWDDFDWENWNWQEERLKQESQSWEGEELRRERKTDGEENPGQESASGLESRAEGEDGRSQESGGENGDGRSQENTVRGKGGSVQESQAGGKDGSVQESRAGENPRG